MKKRLNIPVIAASAARLFLICAVIITAYLLCVVTYIKHYGENPEVQKDALDMLHSAGISVVIALGGSLLFDCELRHGRKNK